jgi:hypothetical protein
MALSCFYLVKQPVSVLAHMVPLKEGAQDGAFFDKDSSSSRPRHRETSKVWEAVRDLRASIPRTLLRTRALSASTDRVWSALMARRGRWSGSAPLGGSRH